MKLPRRRTRLQLMRKSLELMVRWPYLDRFEASPLAPALLTLPSTSRGFAAQSRFSLAHPAPYTPKGELTLGLMAQTQEPRREPDGALPHARC